MSSPYAKLPAWADYGLIPVIILVAFESEAGLLGAGVERKEAAE